MSPIAAVEVPASSANLGSGFDCFAAALSLKLRAELYPGDEPGIVVSGRGEGADEPGSAGGGRNLVLDGFRTGIRAAAGWGGGSGSWRIEVTSMIPAARGLGSSAAAVVAGLLLGISIGRRAPDEEELLALATDLEGHPDNVAAAVHGGVTLAVADGERILVRRFAAPDGWIPVVFIPEERSLTTEMRAVLPDAYSRDDAVWAAGRAALLAVALATGDADLLAPAMDDRLHQPYRLERLPGCAALIERAYAAGARGAALSGAGPTVIAICDSPVSAHAVEKTFAASPISGMAARLRFDGGGARVTRLVA
jgi:homoserine kinase